MILVQLEVDLVLYVIKVDWMMRIKVLGDLNSDMLVVLDLDHYL
jgi:hypothetical protein